MNINKKIKEYIKPFIMFPLILFTIIVFSIYFSSNNIFVKVVSLILATGLGYGAGWSIDVRYNGQEPHNKRINFKIFSYLSPLCLLNLVMFLFLITIKISPPIESLIYSIF